MRWEDSSWYINVVKPASTQNLNEIVRVHDQIRIVRPSQFGIRSKWLSVVFENCATPEPWQACKLQLLDEGRGEVTKDSLTYGDEHTDYKLPLDPYKEEQSIDTRYLNVAQRIETLVKQTPSYARLEGWLKVGSKLEKIILCKTCDCRVVQRTLSLLVMIVLEPERDGSFLQGGIAHADPDLRGR